MIKKKVFFGLVDIAILVFGLSSYAAAQAKVLVITNPACPDIGKDDIKMIFLGYKKVVGDYPVQLFISKDGDVLSTFVQDVLGIKVSEFTSHWLKKALAGEGSGPKKLTDDEIITRAKTVQCAIGVISPKDVPGVKVLLVSSR